MQKRIVVTGMAVNTPLGDSLDTFLSNLLAGNSAITSWKSIRTEKVYGKVGGDLGSYDICAKEEALGDKIPEQTHARLRKLRKKMPWHFALSLFVVLDAFLDSNLFATQIKNEEIATIVAGHNLNQRYVFKSHEIFQEESDFIDGLFALYGLDTNHVGAITDVLKLQGPAYTVGGACASGNMALKCAVNEIINDEVPLALVAAPIVDYSPLDIHAMALMGAITYHSFNDAPEKASRPYDARREGFVPAHGAAALIIEDLEHARRRNAKIYAEIMGVTCSADGNHLPQPSQQGQSLLIKKLLAKCNIKPQEVDYINAHATSTPLGDMTEILAIKDVFGEHAYKLKINAPKSMLGHNCWSAATVETIAAILQMRCSTLHPSINIEELDPEIDLDVCRKKTSHNINVMLKNSFGFGGLNSTALFRKWSE